MATFRYFRFQPTSERSPGVGLIQLSEFWFLNGGSTVTPSTVTGAGGETDINGEVPANLADNNTATKWCNTSGVTGYALFDFGTSVIVTGYRWATANDASERDPVSWTIDGSDDNIAWTTVDTITNFTGTTTRLVYNPDFTLPGGSVTSAKRIPPNRARINRAYNW